MDAHLIQLFKIWNHSTGASANLVNTVLHISDNRMPVTSSSGCAVLELRPKKEHLTGNRRQKAE